MEKLCNICQQPRYVDPCFCSSYFHVEEILKLLKRIDNEKEDLVHKPKRKSSYV